MMADVEQPRNWKAVGIRWKCTVCGASKFHLRNSKGSTVVECYNCEVVEHVDLFADPRFFFINPPAWVLITAGGQPIPAWVLIIE